MPKSHTGNNWEQPDKTGMICRVFVTSGETVVSRCTTLDSQRWEGRPDKTGLIHSVFVIPRVEDMSKQQQGSGILLKTQPSASVDRWTRRGQQNGGDMSCIHRTGHRKPKYRISEFCVRLMSVWCRSGCVNAGRVKGERIRAERPLRGHPALVKTRGDEEDGLGVRPRGRFRAEGSGVSLMW